jgi:hypothetical protein
MDRYTKTVLTVIAGCLLVLAGNQIDFPQKAHAETGAAGAEGASGKLAAVTEQGDVYFMDGGENIYHCLSGKCSKVLD